MLFNEEKTNLFQGRFQKSLLKKERFVGCVFNNNWQFKTDDTKKKWRDATFSDGYKQLQTYKCANIAITRSGFIGKCWNTWGNTRSS
jgi:hypothetical protein